MTFLLSEDIVQFAEVFASYLRNELPAGYVRKRLLESYEENTLGRREFFDLEESNLWRKLAELGVFAAALPEGFGGVDLGLLAVHALVEIASRRMLPIPLTETLTFGLVPLLLAGNGSTQKELLEKICAGTLRCTGAFHSLRDQIAENGWKTVGTVKAQKGKDGLWSLTGTELFVPFCESSELLLVPSRLGKQWGLFAVDLKASGVQIARIPTLDLVRPYSEVLLTNAPARVVHDGELSQDVLERVLDSLVSILSAEIAALGQEALELACEYAKTREQFGKPIGSFQAVQHLLADAALRVQNSLALSRFAGWCCSNDPEQRSLAANAAKGYAGEVIPVAIEQTLQAHGGIGFTFEYDLHLYLRRAQTLRALYGSTAASLTETAEIFIEKCRHSNA